MKFGKGLTIALIAAGLSVIPTRAMDISKDLSSPEVVEKTTHLDSLLRPIRDLPDTVSHNYKLKWWWFNVGKARVDFKRCDDDSSAEIYAFFEFGIKGVKTFQRFRLNFALDGLNYSYFRNDSLQVCDLEHVPLLTYFAFLDQLKQDGEDVELDILTDTGVKTVDVNRVNLEKNPGLVKKLDMDDFDGPLKLHIIPTSFSYGVTVDSLYVVSDDEPSYRRVVVDLNNIPDIRATLLERD